MYPGCNLAVAVFQYETIVMSTADILMHQSVKYVQVTVVIQLLTFQQSWCQQITELCYLMYVMHTLHLHALSFVTHHRNVFGFILEFLIEY